MTTPSSGAAAVSSSSAALAPPAPGGTRSAIRGALPRRPPAAARLRAPLPLGLPACLPRGLPPLCGLRPRLPPPASRGGGRSAPSRGPPRRAGLPGARRPRGRMPFSPSGAAWVGVPDLGEAAPPGPSQAPGTGWRWGGGAVQGGGRRAGTSRPRGSPAGAWGEEPERGGVSAEAPSPQPPRPASPIDALAHSWWTSHRHLRPPSPF